MLGYAVGAQHKLEKAEFMNSWHLTSYWKILSHYQRPYLQFQSEKKLLQLGNVAQSRWTSRAPGRAGQNHCSPGQSHGLVVSGTGEGIIPFRLPLCVFKSLRNEKFLKTTLLTWAQPCQKPPATYSMWSASDTGAAFVFFRVFTCIDSVDHHSHHFQGKAFCSHLDPGSDS